MKGLTTILTVLWMCGHSISMAQTATLTARPQEVVSLNGTWTFQDRQQINVPGEWVMEGFTVNEGETAKYSRFVIIPDHWKGKRVKIRFDAVNTNALVKMNGKTVGSHEGGFVPFEVDVTDALQSGKNELAVEVRALTTSDHLSCASQYAVHTVGGILRKVTMFAVPNAHIADITVTTDFDKNYKDATLYLKTITANTTATPVKTVYRFTLTDASGKTVLRQTIAGDKAIGQQASLEETHSLTIRKPQHWNPEHPYLYVLETALIENGRETHVTQCKVGFREVEVKGNELLVNGSPVKLRGVNRHEVHPLTGRSISPALCRQDALLFRDANCNYIRTSHYPPSEEFLEAADELGLFVESEAALSWIEHHASPIWRLWKYTDQRFLPLMLQANAENMAAGKNHPSVIIWSLGNESRWSALWDSVNTFVKRTDPARPTTFHDQCWGGFNNAGSKADIAVYHYPGINGAAAAAKSTRPVLFGEYAHLSCYNRRELATDPGIRAAYNAPLVTFYDSMYYYKGCLGGAIWSGIDDIFHLPGGNIVGYGPWGPVDGWRRPKPEYAGMKKAYEPVKIMAIRNQANAYELDIENRFDFTSFKDITITANGKPLRLNVAPGKRGTLSIPVTDGQVHVVFKDPRGFVCTETLLGNSPAVALTRPSTPVTYVEKDEAYIVQQGAVTYTISRLKGIITGARKGNDTLLLQGPVVCVAPSNHDDGGKPNVAGETYQNNIYPLKYYPLYTLFAENMQIDTSEQGLRISADITYTSGKGKLTYFFTSNGQLITDYEVRYRGNDSLPYQYGLLMQLPQRYQQLEWEREGAFTVNDSTDISRNQGTALLAARKLGAVEAFGEVPSGPWKNDANELGSNDFRSAKHDIRKASLSNGKGQSVVVSSNGKQASRSWLQDGNIHWLVADYWSNGSEPFYTTPHSNGRININRKTIKGTLTISIP